MPGGDGTGPAGMGPMTGRAAGFCVGNATPGWANGPGGGRGQGGFGRGRGGFGRGRGWGRAGWFQAAGTPVVQPVAGSVPQAQGATVQAPPQAAGQESAELRQQMAETHAMLQRLAQRLDEIEARGVEKPAE